MKVIVAGVALCVFMMGPLGGRGGANMIGPHLPQEKLTSAAFGQVTSPITRGTGETLQPVPASAKSRVTLIHTDPQLDHVLGRLPPSRNAVVPDGGAVTFGWSFETP